MRTDVIDFDGAWYQIISNPFCPLQQFGWESEAAWKIWGPATPSFKCTSCIIAQCPYPAPSLQRLARSEIAQNPDCPIFLSSCSPLSASLARSVLNHGLVMNHGGLFALAAACWMTSVERLREDWCVFVKGCAEKIAKRAVQYYLRASIQSACQHAVSCLHFANQKVKYRAYVYNHYAHLYTRCWRGIACSRNSIGGWSLSVEFRTMVAVKTPRRAVWLVCFDHGGEELGDRPLSDVWFQGCFIPAVFRKCCSLDFVLLRQSYLQRRTSRTLGVRFELEMCCRLDKVQ